MPAERDGRALRALLGDNPRMPVPWRDLPTETVPLDGLRPTQWPHYVPCRVCQQRMGLPPEGGDLPRIVEWRGVRFVWDGHNRVAGLLRAGVGAVTARVWRLGDVG